ncbi:MAG: hypothetical protein ACJ735_00270 [Actinomycetes bacterium]
MIQSFYFGDTLSGGVKVVGDGNEVQIGTGPQRTWLSLDTLGLPAGYMVTVAVGRCIAGQPHAVDSQTATVPVGDDHNSYNDHLRVTFANLRIHADDPTAWVTFAGVHGGGLHGRYFGGIQGALSKFQQAALTPNRRPCSR